MEMFNGINIEGVCLLASFLSLTTATDFKVNRIVANGNVEAEDVELAFTEAKVIRLNDQTRLRYYNNLTFDWEFVIVQAHTKYRNVSLSTYFNRETYTYSNAAILSFISYKRSHLGHTEAVPQHLDYSLQLSSGPSLRSLVAAVTYTGKAPIPGGCCLTCELEVDPNLVITSQRYFKTTLSFSVANVYDYKTSLCGGRPGKKPNHYRLQYSVYQYFLEEGSLDDDTLFDGLTKMLTPSSVKQNGKKVREWNPEKDKPFFVFDTIRGQGIIFNILVYDPQTNVASVYSPVVTYGCSFTAKVDGCDSIGSITNIVLAVCGSFLGLLVCFFGHRFYRLYIALSGWSLFSFIGFILLTNETEWSHNVRMIGSVCIGIAGGAILYLFWWWTGYRHVVLYVCGLSLGFLVAATVFFTPFGNLHFWIYDVNYWTVMLGILLTVPFVFILCLKTFLILVSAVVGAYAFIIGIDTFIHSSLSYIVLNVIMKATVEDFLKYDVPFQWRDWILAALWICLAILGVIVQSVMARGQTTLPWTPRKRRVRTVNLQDDTPGPVVGTGHEAATDYPTVAVNPRPQTEEYEDQRLPILVESRPLLSRKHSVNNKRSTRYGTNIVC